MIIFLIVIGLACNYSADTSNPDRSAPSSSDPTNSAVQTAPQQVEGTSSFAPPQEQISLPIVNSSITEFDQTLITLYEYVSPGVVTVQTITDQGVGLGSGFVYDTQGHIVTNYHVVEDAQLLEVDFPSGIKSYGEVIGTDLDSDLAVIKVDVEPQYLKPLTLGNSDETKVGQTVVAIGNPYRLSGSMTMGIISAKGRTLESTHQTTDGAYFSSGDVIQTDASINPGNSGGPLLNLKGEVVGVNYMIRTSGVTTTGDPVNSGIGFAISVNIVKRVVPVLIEKGSYDYPYLGVTARSELTLMEQEILNIDRTTGAYVLAVSPGSPADLAGLHGGQVSTNIAGLPSGGDLIIAVDGRPVYVFGDLLSYMMVNKNPGDQMNITILRDGEQIDFTVTLNKRP